MKIIKGFFKVVGIILGVFCLLILLLTMEPAKKKETSPFENAKPKLEEYKSGSGDVLGNYGYLCMNKKVFSKATSKQLSDFLENNYTVEKSDYFVFDFDDGTGVRASSKDLNTLYYGEIDVERYRSTAKMIGIITKDGEKYKYKEVEQDDKEIEEIEETPIVEDPQLTLGQKNALREAYSYLNYTAFSYYGLIDQLEYEGYTPEECTYAVDNCGADWNEQAAKKAQSYLDYDSFSRQGLIDQLLYEKFTQEEAEYGVSAVGY